MVVSTGFRNKLRNTLKFFSSMNDILCSYNKTNKCTNINILFLFSFFLSSTHDLHFWDAFVRGNRITNRMLKFENSNLRIIS